MKNNHIVNIFSSLGYQCLCIYCFLVFILAVAQALLILSGRVYFNTKLLRFQSQRHLILVHKQWYPVNKNIIIL